ncbi:hypothetical protein [Seohaeicola zhoushanensis]|uniref:Uncharacterized protein n=1 Tax=Seohaeicola zhoushanensis TaxID=1569283 RepID=A0A8J3H1I3_9RHOB|nr:hypothetical protein [Seohaeicola zhoushanensis]GHF72835.1 hypothetical protein GCM10017056_49620 [Seohaeicola zhoushanensis]
MRALGQQIRHDFAAWAASTAARSSKYARFSVTVGRNALNDEPRLTQVSHGLQFLPEPGEFDAWHRSVCENVQNNLRGLDGETYRFGVSAKLVNVYLKALLVGEFGETTEYSDRVAVVHPPIDRSLLGVLEELDVGGFKAEWRRLKTASWSLFEYEDYVQVISLIRKCTIEKTDDGLPKMNGLWAIEQHWPGYQKADGAQSTSQ